MSKFAIGTKIRVNENYRINNSQPIIGKCGVITKHLSSFPYEVQLQDGGKYALYEDEIDVLAFLPGDRVTVSDSWVDGEGASAGVVVTVPGGQCPNDENDLHCQFYHVDLDNGEKKGYPVPGTCLSPRPETTETAAQEAPAEPLQSAHGFTIGDTVEVTTATFASIKPFTLGTVSGFEDGAFVLVDFPGVYRNFPLLTSEIRNVSKPTELELTQKELAHTQEALSALTDAVHDLYYAGVWSCDRAVDEPKLWSTVRDAAGFTPGNGPRSTNQTVVGRLERIDVKRVIDPYNVGPWTTTLHLKRQPGDLPVDVVIPDVYLVALRQHPLECK